MSSGATVSPADRGRLGAIAVGAGHAGLLLAALLARSEAGGALDLARPAILAGLVMSFGLLLARAGAWPPVALAVAFGALGFVPAVVAWRGVVVASSIGLLGVVVAGGVASTASWGANPAFGSVRDDITVAFACAAMPMLVIEGRWPEASLATHVSSAVAVLGGVVAVALAARGLPLSRFVFAVVGLLDGFVAFDVLSHRACAASIAQRVHPGLVHAELIRGGFTIPCRYPSVEVQVAAPVLVACFAALRFAWRGRSRPGASGG